MSLENNKKVIAKKVAILMTRYDISIKEVQEAIEELLNKDKEVKKLLLNKH